MAPGIKEVDFVPLHGSSYVFHRFILFPCPGGTDSPSFTGKLNLVAFVVENVCKAQFLPGASQPLLEDDRGPDFPRWGNCPCGMEVQPSGWSQHHCVIPDSWRCQQQECPGPRGARTTTWLGTRDLGNTLGLPGRGSCVRHLSINKCKVYCRQNRACRVFIRECPWEQCPWEERKEAGLPRG